MQEKVTQHQIETTPPMYHLNYNSISLTNCLESPHPTSIGLQTTLIYYQNCNIRLSLIDHVLLLYRKMYLEHLITDFAE